jgi:hypothetical protein
LKWDQNQNMVRKDALSIGQKTSSQTPLVDNVGSDNGSEDDDSEDPSDINGDRPPSPEDSEQNVQQRSRKRKHTVSRMKALRTIEMIDS